MVSRGEDSRWTYCGGDFVQDGSGRLRGRGARLLASTWPDIHVTDAEAHAHNDMPTSLSPSQSTRSNWR